jgi:hypothetical protein
VAFGNKTYKLNLKNPDFKYDNYTRNLVGRSFGRCLRNRPLLSGSSLRFTNSTFGCALRRTLYCGYTCDMKHVLRKEIFVGKLWLIVCQLVMEFLMMFGEFHLS